MDKILVVSTAAKGAEALSSLLRQIGGNADITISVSGSDARGKVLDLNLDLVLINAPLLDESGVELARMIVEETLSPVIMVVRSDFFTDLQSQMEQYGVLVVEKPIIRELFVQTIGISHSLRHRLVGMQLENDRLQKKIDEIKLVDQAKWALMSNLGMEEAQAHKYIEKQAMDQRKSRSEIANGILRTYR